LSHLLNDGWLFFLLSFIPHPIFKRDHSRRRNLLLIKNSNRVFPLINESMVSMSSIWRKVGGQQFWKKVFKGFRKNVSTLTRLTFYFNLSREHKQTWDNWVTILQSYHTEVQDPSIKSTFVKTSPWNFSVSWETHFCIFHAHRIKISKWVQTCNKGLKTQRWPSQSRTESTLTYLLRERQPFTY